MSLELLRLYPTPTQACPLQGLYLSHDLRRSAPDGQPFVYSNYVLSLDGRIAVPEPDGSDMRVPPNVSNDRDWRLFQELAVQADIHFTSGRYLRDYSAGRAQEILRVYDEPRFADLKEWRQARGLSPYPALAVISGSLDFEIPEALASTDRRVIVVTTESADPIRRRALAAQAEIIAAPGDSIRGDWLVAQLQERNCPIMYNTTGPRVLHLLLSSGVLDRLYLTYTSRILGGMPYATIVEGDLLEPAPDFTLRSLYYDPKGLDGLGQLFSAYDRAGA